MTTSPSRRAAAKSLALAAAGVAVSASSRAATPTAGAPANARYKAVFAVSDADPARWNLVLGNIHNAQADLGAENVVIELVAYAGGIGMLKLDAETAQRVSEAARAGVLVSACENSMRGHNLTRAQLNPQASTVPSGVGHLIRRQNEGYAYIRS
jgi:intracellular sulfur oxidation DsrE/DsrF family protein